MSTQHRALGCALILTAAISSAHADTTSITQAKSKALNPDIGVNFLGLLQRGTSLSSNRLDSDRNGFQLQETEFQFSADVDPYLRAVTIFAVAQEDGEWGIDPEEVYAETISLPGVTLRAGKYYLALGRHNQLHTHAFPFIDAPLIHQRLLGPEGLNEFAVGASILIPASWYSEVVAQAFDPGNDVAFVGSESGAAGGLVHLKNLFDLSDDLTFELGLSGAVTTRVLDAHPHLYGADLTLKWRPSEGGKYHALVWSTEYLMGYSPSGNTEHIGGGATWLQYQFAQRWWMQGRAEVADWPNPKFPPTTTKQSALLGFFPSEFSGFRLQYSHQHIDNGSHDHTVALQFNVSIGAHPAHAY